MHPYLQLEIGDPDNIRGRVVMHVEPDTNHLLEVNGPALQEALYSELLNGRLVALNLFEPFYVRSRSLPNAWSRDQLVEHCQKEILDLVDVQTLDPEYEKGTDVLLEQAIARYTTIYREKAYRRVLQGLFQDVFHLRKRVVAQEYYGPLFQLAYWMCQLTCARRNTDKVEMSYGENMLNQLRGQLPVLDMTRIVHTLACGDAGEWYEVANYVDTLFLTLKKHYPLPLANGNLLTVNNESSSWIEEPPASIMEEYFLALLREEYERAMDLRPLFESNPISESLEGCSNS